MRIVQVLAEVNAIDPHSTQCSPSSGVQSHIIYVISLWQTALTTRLSGVSTYEIIGQGSLKLIYLYEDRA